MKNILLLLLFIPFFGSSQITGTIIDQTTKDPVYGAKVFASTGERVISDFDGIFVIQPKSYPVTLIITAKTFLTDTIKITKKEIILLNYLSLFK